MLRTIFVVVVIGLGIVEGCHDLGQQKVVEDPRCSNGESLGCNAGGEGQNCRFCWAIPTDPLCTGTATTGAPAAPTTTTAKSSCSYPCKDVGGDKVICDPTCSLGDTIGCNAGAQGQDCRFCWAVPIKCLPTTAQPTTPKPTTTPTTTPKPTTTTRKASTTTKTTTTSPIPTTTQPRSTQSTTTGPTTTPGPTTPYVSTTPKPDARCSGPDPLAQTACTKEEAFGVCNCGDNTFCCIEGNAVGGCSANRWSAPICSCACEVVPLPVSNCTWTQYLYSPCNRKTAPYYCPSSNGCAPSKFRCPDLCYLTELPPYPAKPPNKGTYTPSNNLTPQTLTCGAMSLTTPPQCATQPDDSSWSHSAERKAQCGQNGWWCPDTLKGWQPSKYQCGPTMDKTDVCPVNKLQGQSCRVAPSYVPPSWAPQLQTKTGYCDTNQNCDNVDVSSHCVGCCLWDNPVLECKNYWEVGKGSKCTKVSPRWNWIITTCDTMGGQDFGGVCRQNPFSQVDVRYIATYQLAKAANGNFVWQLVPESSLNANGQAKYVDFSSLPTEATVGPNGGPIRSCSGGGGGWNAAFFPYKSAGVTPPAFMFVMSYDKFYNAAWILDGGPATSTCSDMTNCWGEISAGEIDFLETPNLFPNMYKTESGWKYYRATSYNAANRCWACNHANYDGSLNIAGCGGEPAGSFYNANGEGADDQAHVWAAVVDARGTTIYKDPTWPGITADCAADELVNLHPTKPQQQQPCFYPDRSCAIFMPGCVTNISEKTSTIVDGDYSRIPQCWYVDWAVHTTCTENWWNLMMDTGQWMIKDPPIYEP